MVISLNPCLDKATFLFKMPPILCTLALFALEGHGFTSSIFPMKSLGWGKKGERNELSSGEVCCHQAILGLSCNFFFFLISRKGSFISIHSLLLFDEGMYRTEEQVFPLPLGTSQLLRQ